MTESTTIAKKATLGGREHHMRYSTQSIPVFVISLPSAVERREAMRRHLQSMNIEHEFIEGVDGRKLPRDELVKLVAPNVTLHPGTVGCYLSHLEAYRRIASESLPVALILEDDALLERRITGLLRDGIPTMDFDYCFLDCDAHNDRGPVFYDVDSELALGSGFRAYTLSEGPQTLHAYLITCAAAQRRLDHAFPIMKAIDLYDHLPYRIHFRAIVGRKAAWVSEHSLTSSTSAKHVPLGQLTLAALRRWPIFYTLRDFAKLQPIRDRATLRAAQQRCALPLGRRWRVLPAGRLVLVT